MRLAFTDMAAHTADIGIGAMLGDSRFDGVNVHGEGFFFSDIIDEVAVYNTALSGTVIKTHFDAADIPAPTALPPA